MDQMLPLLIYPIPKLISVRKHLLGNAVSSVLCILKPSGFALEASKHSINVKLPLDSKERLLYEPRQCISLYVQ